MIQSILQIGDKKLTTRSSEVTFPLSKETLRLIDDMFDTMLSVGDLGAGLSAVQIGHLERICFARRFDIEERVQEILEIIDKNERIRIFKEFDFSKNIYNKLENELTPQEFVEFHKLLESEKMTKAIFKKLNKYFDKYLFELLINPKVLSSSSEKSGIWEGCLSVGIGDDALYAPVFRSNEIEIEYFDKLGNKQNLVATSWLSHVILHEIDHMDGILFLSRVSDISRIHKAKDLDNYYKKNKKYPGVDAKF